MAVPDRPSVAALVRRLRLAPPAGASTDDDLEVERIRLTQPAVAALVDEAPRALPAMLAKLPASGPRGH